ncbi:MAG: DUF4097 domain-containing protein [Acidibacter sp.]|jgi:hypothetical protein|nr:DUF4097 domain-containing protein [Acidibacter sp.]
MKTFAVFTAVSCLMVVGPIALAADNVRTVKHVYPASGISRLVVDNRVGEVRIRPGTGDSYEVTVNLEGNRHGLMRKLKSVDGLDINAKTSNGRLHLKFNEDDVEADWTILLPKALPEEVGVNLGVGQVDLSAPNSAISIDLGVGDVDVRTNKASAGDITLTVGVGEASVRGTPSTVKASGVASNVSSKGDGARDVTVTVGVGDASVVLN